VGRRECVVRIGGIEVKDYLKKKAERGLGKNDWEGEREREREKGRRWNN
jgi:hypothetical protein